MSYRKLVLIDLDGVLNTYKGDFNPNCIPSINCGAKEFLKELSKEYDIKLFTTRNRLIASKWLIENQIDEYFRDITNVKEPCSFFVDDRCIRFNGDYTELLEDIRHFTVWWK